MSVRVCGSMTVTLSLSSGGHVNPIFFLTSGRQKRVTVDLTDTARVQLSCERMRHLFQLRASSPHVASRTQSTHFQQCVINVVCGFSL
jgi:hypothetical protein